MPDLVLDTDRLVESALDATGLDDFGEPTWQAGLAQYADSLRSEAGLHELGEQIAAGEITEYLSTRLGLVDWRKQHPEIAAADVTPPIVIVGQSAHRHHDPARPPRARSRQPRAAHVGGG